MSDTTDTVENRSEIVFLYDAEDTNPNGNPLSANDKPRMDETTGKAVVTDVRLKRYIRDQLDDDGHGIYIRNPSKADYQGAIDRDDLFKSVTGLDDEEIGELTGNEAADAFLNNATDVRYFGATCSFSSDFQDELGDGFPGQFIGPVQFSHARSLNTVVQKSESQQLSTVVSSGGDSEQGTFATDNRLQYALIPFHGIANEVGAESTGLTTDDVKRLDSLLWRALKNQTLTRSKMGHHPQLYIRVEYSTDEFHIGRLDDGLDTAQETPDSDLRNIGDVELDVSTLVADIEAHSEHIEEVHLNANPHLTVVIDEEIGGPDLLAEELKNTFGEDGVDEIDVYGEN